MSSGSAKDPLRLVAATLLAVFLALSGCATTQCLRTPTSETEILSVRNVAAVIVTEDIADRDEIREQVEEASDIFFGQTGIRLQIQDWREIRWHASSRDKLLQELVDEMRDYKKPYDVVIAFYDMNPLQRLGFNLIGGWMGVIDDVYRKFIVIRRDQPRILVHELGHVFLFEHVHTGGIMTGFTLCAIGDHLCVDSSVCFLDQDVREIVKNKWRDFNRKPELTEKQDIINGLFYSKTYIRWLYDHLFTPAADHPPPAEGKVR